MPRELNIPTRLCLEAIDGAVSGRCVERVTHDVDTLRAFDDGTYTDVGTNVRRMCHVLGYNKT